ncbi:hypothetical protein SPRG_00373 [Saprolegnia parasitica CBS 223.65]|uniref:RanBD1 domain-containing protein n=1 Tax=Saprolegnia parasitica (strain CBS 223.65) TaxID=695850 RepID=A0A067D945_SAPPC|nr:hypothetical protein SPRG_00373 [Saprolegnia parasitica CBS 223.65]KDO35527.1 hypothetical protein SPRG_00373 [Saprolegnia parasitica CBS 223.65]|eukprot:XP_012193862.1 hypothetical protein SPRG_00373 [Saprolegnia parasitica CBS 223.65]
MSSPSHAAPATAASPVAKRQRQEGDGDVHTEHHNDDDGSKKTSDASSPKRKSPTKATDAASPKKAEAPSWGFTSFASTNGFAAAKPATTGFGAASTTTGFGAFASASGFGAFASSSAATATFGDAKPTGFGTTFGAVASAAADTDATSTWTEASTGNDEFLSTEAAVAEAPVKVPVVELPKDYQHVTGEENEEVLLLLQVKLFKFTDGKYVECGSGPLKVLRHVDSDAKRDRLVMRRATSDFKAGTHLLLNSLLSAVVHVTLKPKNLVVQIATNPTTITSFLIRTATIEDGDALLALLQP